MRPAEQLFEIVGGAIDRMEETERDITHRWIFHGPDTVRLTRVGNQVIAYKFVLYPDREVFEAIALNGPMGRKLRQIIRSELLGV